MNFQHHLAIFTRSRLIQQMYVEVKYNTSKLAPIFQRGIDSDK